MGMTYPFLTPGTYTARQVLLHVADIIEQEPLRLNMWFWVSAIRGQWEVQPSGTPKLPACGTVACVGGHICLNLGLEHTDALGSRAMELLGLLTGPNFNDYYYDDSTVPAARTAKNDLNRLFFQMKASPTAVVAELREICRRYRASLQRKHITVKERN